MINIVAGGPDYLIPDLTQIAAQDVAAIWIGVDRGALYLIEAGINPHCAIGDFDSVSASEKQLIQNSSRHFQTFQTKKDYTDLESALRYACELSGERIFIYGATGGRIDHQMSSMMLLEGFIQKKEIVLIDIHNEIRMLAPGTYSFHKNDKKYISILAVSDYLTGLTLSGMKYPLLDHTLHRRDSLAISNEISNEVGHISFSDGICLVVRSKD